MSYDKTTWATGDIVTSARLNKMEEGIYSGFDGMFLVHATVDPDSEQTGNGSGGVIVDKTINEIMEAYENGKLPVMEAIEEIAPGVQFKMILLPIMLGSFGDNASVAFQHIDISVYTNNSRITRMLVSLQKTDGTETAQRTTQEIIIPNAT